MKNEIMNWTLCERDFIKIVDADLEKIKSLKKKAEKRLVRARKELNDVDFATEDYYEVIKELLTAYMLKFGMRSKNHQCLISYFLKENPSLDKEAYLIQQMSFFRNRLDYYGEDVPKEFLDSNKEDFEKIIKLLFELIDRGDKK
ncbi:MAG: hypothetical protein WCI72_00810 [archaeon]